MADFGRLNSILQEYDEIEAQLCDPMIASDPTRFREYSKKRSKLEPIYQCYGEYERCKAELAAVEASKEDDDSPEWLEMWREERSTLQTQLAGLEEQLTMLLLPRDPHDGEDLFVEIRAGAGGEEAALFVAALYRMYLGYANNLGWKTEIVSSNETELGGYKEIVFLVQGDEAWRSLRYESGVHRVQRVPTTESGGRIHTSTVTVAVLPMTSETAVVIRNEDLEFDVYRASGAGGQHVNKTSSAIRVRHKPSGLVVTCQDQRSQHQNKARALQVLQARLEAMVVEEAEAARDNNRASQVGTGGRSERIRTYNYPQSRVTDHRIGLTLYRLDDILNGDIEHVVKPLQLKLGQNGSSDIDITDEAD